jgi:hypothetical protein
LRAKESNPGERMKPHEYANQRKLVRRNKLAQKQCVNPNGWSLVILGIG